MSHRGTRKEGEGERGRKEEETGAIISRFNRKGGEHGHDRNTNRDGYREDEEK